MTAAIGAHLRRHDTYHSWFECSPDGRLPRRRTLTDPEDIELVAVEHGELTTAQIRAHVLGGTGDPTEWGCFGFGIVQRADHFTVYMSVDHLVTDGMSAGVIFLELHMGYAALLHGMPLALPAAASYRAFSAAQRAYAESLTLESPEVKAWIDVARNNAGTLPGFALPLGDPAQHSRGAMLVVPLLDERQGVEFDAACEAAGVRFTGAMFACAALAEHRLTGAPTYYALTPYDLRETDAERMTAGWFASFLPVCAPVQGQTFAEIARSAQASFDANKGLARVPFDHVVELAAGPDAELRMPDRDVPLLSFIDARRIPLTDQWDELNAHIFGDSRSSDQVCMWVNRFKSQTTLTISFPDNDVARHSVLNYIDAIKGVYAAIADRDCVFIG